MKIIDLSDRDPAVIQEVASLLLAGFKAHWPNAWPTMEAALNEVHESLDAERISRIAVNDQGQVRQRRGSAFVGLKDSSCSVC